LIINNIKIEVMKQSNKQYIKDIRNWYHVLIGFAVGYGLILLFGFNNRENFPLSWSDFRTLLAPIVGGILVGFASFLWEKQQDKVSPNSSDMRDVACSGISAFIGGLSAIIYGNIVVAIILLGISTVVVFKHFKN